MSGLEKRSADSITLIACMAFLMAIRNSLGHKTSLYNLVYWIIRGSQHFIQFPFIYIYVLLDKRSSTLSEITRRFIRPSHIAPNRLVGCGLSSLLSVLTEQIAQATEVGG